MSDSRVHVKVQDPCDEQSGELVFSVYQGVENGDVGFVTPPQSLEIHSTVLCQFKAKIKISRKDRTRKMPWLWVLISEARILSLQKFFPCA